MSFDLRPANPLHAPVLAAIHAEAFDEAWTLADMAVLLKDPGAVAVLAVATDEDPAGFALCRRAADEAEVLTIAVRPSWRRQGLGRRLLMAAGQRLAEAGAATLFLEVAADNAAAQALYARLGFVEVGRRKGYYRGADGTARDALVLSATLPFRD